MPRFRYKFTDGSGAKASGEMEAMSREEVVAQLVSEGRTPLEVKASGSDGAWWRVLLPTERKAGAKEVTAFTSKMATLLSAHLPIDQALALAVESASNELERSLVEDMRRSVRSGIDLGSALERSDVFSADYIAVVRAGEAAGTLEETFSLLGERLERSQEFSSRIRSALFYPMLLALLVVATLALIFGFVLPQFEQIFESAGAELPLITELLLGASSLVQDWWWAIILGVVALYLAFRVALSRPGLRHLMDGWLLGSRLTLGLLRARDTAWFYQTLALLIERQVALSDAVELSRATIANTYFSKRLEALTGDVRRGRSLSAAMEDTGVFPSTALQLLKVGEASGQLPEMLSKAGDIYERELYEKLERLVTVAVPLMTILMGAIVAAIIASVLVGVLAINEIAF